MGQEEKLDFKSFGLKALEKEKFLFAFFLFLLLGKECDSQLSQKAKMKNKIIPLILLNNINDKPIARPVLEENPDFFT